MKDLREKVARAIEQYDDPLNQADAAIRAVREHLESEEAVERACRAEMDDDKIRPFCNGPFFNDDKRMRCALLAALGEA